MNYIEALDAYSEVSQTIGGLVERHRISPKPECYSNIRQCDCQIADTYRERKTRQRTLRAALLAPGAMLDG